jgi:hypothetical protein
MSGSGVGTVAGPRRAEYSPKPVPGLCGAGVQPQPKRSRVWGSHDSQDNFETWGNDASLRDTSRGAKLDPGNWARKTGSNRVLPILILLYTKKLLRTKYRVVIIVFQYASTFS